MPTTSLHPSISGQLWSGGLAVPDDRFGHEGEGHERLLTGVELDHQQAAGREHPLPANSVEQLRWNLESGA